MTYSYDRSKTASNTIGEILAAALDKANQQIAKDVADALEKELAGNSALFEQYGPKPGSWQVKPHYVFGQIGLEIKGGPWRFNLNMVVSDDLVKVSGGSFAQEFTYRAGSASPQDLSRRIVIDWIHTALVDLGSEPFVK